MSFANQDVGLGVGFLGKLVKKPKIYEVGDRTAFIPVGRFSSSPGWCFLPWKGVEGAYKWGFKARPEISDYFSALVGLQKTFLSDEKADFEVTKKGQRVLETQRRARWRDGDTRPNQLMPKRGWLEVPVDDLESLGQAHSEGAVLALPSSMTSSFGGSENFSARSMRARTFQGSFSFGTSVLWNGRCAITGSTLALEAAHLKPVSICADDDPALKDPYNGILLTASLHRLMDAGIFGFDRTGKVVVESELSQEEREIHQLAGGCTVKFLPEAMKYVEYRLKHSK